MGLKRLLLQASASFAALAVATIILVRALPTGDPPAKHPQPRAWRYPGWGPRPAKRTPSEQHLQDAMSASDQAERQGHLSEAEAILRRATPLATEGDSDRWVRLIKLDDLLGRSRQEFEDLNHFLAQPDPAKYTNLDIAPYRIRLADLTMLYESTERARRAYGRVTGEKVGTLAVLRADAYARFASSSGLDVTRAVLRQYVEFAVSIAPSDAAARRAYAQILGWPDGEPQLRLAQRLEQGKEALGPVATPHVGDPLKHGRLMPAPWDDGARAVEFVKDILNRDELAGLEGRP